MTDPLTINTGAIQDEASKETQWNPPPVEQGKGYLLCKRLFDVTFALVGLLICLPFAVVIALVIKATDRGPILFRQRRVGKDGGLFEIIKFRTMIVNAEKAGPQVTKGRDPRITGIGWLLRGSKLDELPQLWNVLVGHMSFVGPRPEVPHFVARYTPEQRLILRFKPGITDLATLVFRDEETLLRNAVDVEEFYVQHCIPRKFKLNLQYARRANVIEDSLIIMETLCPYWLGVMCGYILALAISFWLACELRFDFRIPEDEATKMHRIGWFILPLQMIFLIWRRQFVGLLSYFDSTEVRQLASGLTQAALVQFSVWYVTGGEYMPARSIIAIDAIISFTLIAGTRTWLRQMRETRNLKLRRHREASKEDKLRVGIVGAGELGAWLAKQINDLGKGNRQVVVFFDDDPDKWTLSLCDVPVFGMPECIADGSWSDKLDEVIVATPGATAERQRQIEAILGSANIKTRRLPSLEEMLGQ